MAIALRRYGESLEAATRLIAESKDAGLIANAWFNIGLACERSDRSSVQYNGESYCMSSRIFPFLQSWRATNSRARAEKLEQLLSAPGRERCVVSQPDSTAHHYVFVRGADRDDTSGPDVQRIYVLHPAGSTVSAEQVHWSVTPYVGKNPGAATGHASLGQQSPIGALDDHRARIRGHGGAAGEDRRPPMFLALQQPVQPLQIVDHPPAAAALFDSLAPRVDTRRDIRADRSCRCAAW